MARSSLSRSNSSSSTLSCITIDKNAGIPDNNMATSFTPPTSVTDVSSITSAHADSAQPVDGKSRRVQRVCTRPASYNVNALSGTTRASPRRKTQGNAEHEMPNGTTKDNANDSQKQLVEDSIQVLNIDWSVHGAPQPTVPGVSRAIVSPKKARSKRADLISRASKAVGKTSSVLGKRGRDAVEASAVRIHGLTKRANLRSRDQKTSAPATTEEPAKKRARTANSAMTEQAPADASKTNPPPKPKVKRWLSQGLYVGQDPNFDPRYNTTQNQKRKTSSSRESIKQRKILPLPMFLGKKMLEQGRDFVLPWDVFNPLPPGQPKPEEWRKTRKNVFVGEAADIWKTSKKLEISTCICEPDTGCDEDCFNRFMFYECDESNCNIGPEDCTNRSFAELRRRTRAGGKYNIGVEVIKTNDRGYGVRSNRMFEPNQVIVEYTGEIITQDECDERMRKRYKDNECFYLMVFDQNMIIDATRGSIARFVNHSCEPNCKMVKWTVAGQPRMALFAGDNGIMTGEELTYDYNFDPFSSKNIQECRCRTSSCRGVLGPRPKDRELKDALKPLLHTGTKRKLQHAVSSTIQTLITKKRKLAVAKSVKSSVRSVKKKTSAQVTKVKVGGVQKRAKFVKTMSKKSRKTVQKARSRKGASVTYSRNSKIPPRPKPGAEEKASIRAKPILVSTGRSRNVVRTIKGTNRGPRKGTKSIRVIGA